MMLNILISLTFKDSGFLIVMLLDVGLGNILILLSKRLSGTPKVTELFLEMISASGSNSIELIVKLTVFENDSLFTMLSKIRSNSSPNVVCPLIGKGCFHSEKFSVMAI